MSKTENTNTETKQQETTNSKIDISAIDYDALACVIMDASNVYPVKFINISSIISRSCAV